MHVWPSFLLHSGIVAEEECRNDALGSVAAALPARFTCCMHILLNMLRGSVVGRLVVQRDHT